MNHSRESGRARAGGAFSLLEMLIVVTVMAILITLVTSGFMSGLNAGRLRNTEARFSAAVAAARQEAITHNQPAELRIYQVARSSDGAGNVAWRGWQVVRRQSDGTFLPIGGVEWAEQGVVAHPDGSFSNLLYQFPGTTIPGEGPVIEGNSSLPYASIRFRPDGSTTLPKDTNWSLTFVEEADLLGSSTSLPDNYRSVVVNSFTGATIGY